MHRGSKGRRLPLKTVYYLSFLFFIVIPILVVLVGALLILNKQFKNQALTNIRQAQETVIAELKSDIDIMSMRLSHLIIRIIMKYWLMRRRWIPLISAEGMSMSRNWNRRGIWRWSR